MLKFVGWRRWNVFRLKNLLWRPYFVLEVKKIKITTLLIILTRIRDFAGSNSAGHCFFDLEIEKNILIFLGQFDFEVGIVDVSFWRPTNKHYNRYWCVFLTSNQQTLHSLLMCLLNAQLTDLTVYLSKICHWVHWHIQWWYLI